MSVTRRWSRLARYLLPLIALAVLVPSDTPLFAATPTAPAQERQAVRIGRETFRLELALDRRARAQGLSDRKEVAADGGMLFVFPRPEPLDFFMRRCLVPIDIIYLDGQGRVLNTHAMKNEPPSTPDSQLKLYPSRGPAQFAIELRGGTIERLRKQGQLKPGQKIELPIAKLAARATD